MPTITFPPVQARASRTGPCPTCGKPTRRTRTFEHTISPFNRHPDGTPKTPAEVLAAVRADADAWTPDPAVFEHAKCLASRLAPPVADPAPMPLGLVHTYAARCAAIVQAAEWMTARHLPVPTVEIDVDTDPVKIGVRYVAAADIPMWARALGLDEIRIEASGHCWYIGMRADVDSLAWNVRGIIHPPEVGDQLGEAPVEWRRDSRGRKTGTGTVRVDDLAAGLGRMGIAVTLPVDGRESLNETTREAS